MSAPSSMALPAELLPLWLAQTSDLLAQTDDTGRITWANAAFVAATGLGPGAVLLALAPEEPACVAARATLVEALAAGALAGNELELRSAGGGSCVLRARAASAAGLVLWTLQDVTPLRRLEAQGRRQRELLDMAQKFGRLGV